MAEQKNQESLKVEEAVVRSEMFFMKNKNAIIGGVVVVVLIIAGIFSYKYLYAQPREEKAQIALYQGQQYFEQNAYEQALNGDSISFKGFLNVADEYSGTKVGNLAKAYAGICYAQMGKAKEAIAMLEGFDGDDQMVAPAILGAIGNCYAEAGDLDKAASMLLSAAGKADNNSLSPVFLLQAGLILEKQGKYGEAVDAYTQVKEKYPMTFQAMDIDKYIERAKLQQK